MFYQKQNTDLDLSKFTIQEQTVIMQALHILYVLAETDPVIWPCLEDRDTPEPGQTLFARNVLSLIIENHVVPDTYKEHVAKMVDYLYFKFETLCGYFDGDEQFPLSGKDFISVMYGFDCCEQNMSIIHKMYTTCGGTEHVFNRDTDLDAAAEQTERIGNMPC